MNKDYLEALNWLLANEMIYRGRTQLPISPTLRDIKQYLEAIDNTNPSEALEELKELHELAYGNEKTSWKIDEIRMSSHIKQALQRLEAIDNSKPSEALEALERLKTAPTFMGGTTEYMYCTNSETLLMQDYNIVRQVLLKAQEQEKVLEIIFEKNVWVARLKGLFKKYNNDLDVLRIYNANMPSIDYQLTQEEFELLKRY